MSRCEHSSKITTDDKQKIYGSTEKASKLPS